MYSLGFWQFTIAAIQRTKTIMPPWRRFFDPHHDERTSAERRLGKRISSPIVPIAPPVRPTRPPLTIDVWYKLIWQHRLYGKLRCCDEGDYLHITSDADLDSAEPVSCETQMIWDGDQHAFTCSYDSLSNTFIDFRNEALGAGLYKLEVGHDTIDDGGEKMFVIKACGVDSLSRGREHLIHQIWAKKVDKRVPVGYREWNGVGFSAREEREVGVERAPDQGSSMLSIQH